MLITSSPTFGYKQRSTIPKNSLKTIHPNFLLYSAPILPYTRFGSATHLLLFGFLNPCVLSAPDARAPQAFAHLQKGTQITLFCFWFCTPNTYNNIMPHFYRFCNTIFDISEILSLHSLFVYF